MHVQGQEYFKMCSIYKTEILNSVLKEKKPPYVALVLAVSIKAYILFKGAVANFLHSLTK